MPSKNSSNSTATMPKQPETNIPNPISKTIPNSSCLQAKSNADQIVRLPSAVVQFQSNMVEGFLRVLLYPCFQVTLVADTFVHRFWINTQPSPNPISVAVVE